MSWVHHQIDHVTQDQHDGGPNYYWSKIWIEPTWRGHILSSLDSMGHSTYWRYTIALWRFSLISTIRRYKLSTKDSTKTKSCIFKSKNSWKWAFWKSWIPNPTSHMQRRRRTGRAKRRATTRRKKVIFPPYFIFIFFFFPYLKNITFWKGYQSISNVIYQWIDHISW